MASATLQGEEGEGRRIRDENGMFLKLETSCQRCGYWFTVRQNRWAWWGLEHAGIAFAFFSLFFKKTFCQMSRLSRNSAAALGSDGVRGQKRFMKFCDPQRHLCFVHRDPPGQHKKREKIKTAMLVSRDHAVLSMRRTFTLLP